MYFVRPENVMLLCSVSQRGRRKKGICGGGGGGLAREKFLHVFI